MKLPKRKTEINGIGFVRYEDVSGAHHRIELYLNGEIPQMGFSTKKIIKMLKRY